MLKKKVLITGASGFVGQHLIKQLKQQYEIIGAVSPRSSLSSLDGVTYTALDVADSEATQTIVEQQRPDYIVHLAAQTTNWFQNPAPMFATNLSGTINLYEAVWLLKEKDGYNPKILYVSSSEVYGRTTNPELISEDAPFYPVNHYASSKAAADRVSYGYSQSNKLNIVIARAFTHTGPGKKQGTFVSDMAAQIVQLEQDAKGNEIRVGNLNAVRDYLDVRDVVRAYKLILEADLLPGTALNVCSGKGVRVRDILDSMIKLANKEIVAKNDPERTRPSDVPVFVGDNTKLMQATGWKPSIQLEDTLSETLEYWRRSINEKS